MQAPGASITGLAMGDGALWAVDASTNTVHMMSTTDGKVLFSFQIDLPQSVDATGLAYSESDGLLLVGGWDYGYNGYVYKYSQQGVYQGSVNMCGG